MTTKLSKFAIAATAAAVLATGAVSAQAQVKFVEFVIAQNGLLQPASDQKLVSIRAQGDLPG